MERHELTIINNGNGQSLAAELHETKYKRENDRKPKKCAFSNNGSKG